VAAGAIAVAAGNALNRRSLPCWERSGTRALDQPAGAPGVAPIAVSWRAFAAEVSFLFGLPVLTLGSDYFGIATLGFTIVINTLMTNSDTILPFQR